MLFDHVVQYQGVHEPQTVRKHNDPRKHVTIEHAYRDDNLDADLACEAIEIVIVSTSSDVPSGSACVNRRQKDRHYQLDDVVTHDDRHDTVAEHGDERTRQKQAAIAAVHFCVRFWR